MLAHGFSDRALCDQEGLIRSHVDLLVDRLRALGGKPTNTVRWMHHISYDVIAHLCFGQDQHALDANDWFSPAKVVFDGIREGVALVEMLRYVPFKVKVLNFLVWAFGKARRQNFEVSVSRATARLNSGHTDNIDFSTEIHPLPLHLILLTYSSFLHPTRRGVRQGIDYVRVDSEYMPVDRCRL